jgi:CHAD domain-containing protein
MSKLRHIEWNERLDPAANARRQLSRLVADYFVAMRGWLKSDPSPPALHQARLASKRVRYTLELFRPCYGPGLEARLEGLRRLQRVLGDVNDAAATRRLLGESLTAEVPHNLLPPDQPPPDHPSDDQLPDNRLATFLDARAESKAQEFRKEWTEVFDAPGQFQWWIGYLARYAKTPGRH